MVKLPVVDDFLKEYIVVENDSKKFELNFLQKGIKFKVSKIDDYYAVCKITSTIKECDSMIVNHAKILSENCTKDISDLKHSLDLWNESPEKFIKNERKYKENTFLRTDGVKPKYSYQATLNEFENKEWYEIVIEEQNRDLKKWTTLNAETKKYLYNITKSKRNIPILILNEISFDFVENKITKRPPFPLEITGEQLNEILGYIFEGEIEDADVQEVMDETGIDISVLEGWEFDCESDGEMYNDGQIITYTITFTSPDKHEYSASNSHNAIRGWDFSGKIDW